MTKEVITIDINQGAAEAARLMADKHISSVVVLEKENPIGIITERDFVKKSVRRNWKFLGLRLEK